MGLLDGMIGGFIGVEMASLLNGVIASHGGISGIVSKFEQGGLGPTVQSWVSKGPNAAISSEQIHSVLGADLMQQLSTKTGLSTQDLAQKLSEVLPVAIDKLTPQGVIPKT
jgi:uncharacterized protein YidB (DUF937 family)